MASACCMAIALRKEYWYVFYIGVLGFDRDSPRLGARPSRSLYIAYYAYAGR